MHLVVSLNRADCRHWLLGLADGIAQAGHKVSFDIRPGRIQPSATLLDRLETKLFGEAENALAPLDPAALPALAPGLPVDHRIELSSEDQNGMILFLDGQPGIHALPRRLAAGHIPFVEIRTQDGEIRAAGLPAVEEPAVMARAARHFTSRLTTLFLMAMTGRDQPLPLVREPDRAALEGSRAMLLARTLFVKIAHRAAGGKLRKEHWRIGLRAHGGEPTGTDGDYRPEGFSWLRDDGNRYYADPILWEEEGRHFLFLEEFPYATARGLIGYTELDAGGHPLFTPRPIIERKTHLSYPFLFRHEGALYMAPENAAENHVPLYRARRFPDDWEEMPPLLPNLGLHDATLFPHAGEWWLLGNDPLGASSWDCLRIFRAPSPLGPFVPHETDPALVDARISRSAGPVLAMGDRLIRPVQCCLGGYGRFLRFMEIEALGPNAFRQREIGRIAAPLGGAIAGLHTYARDSRFEAIDALTGRDFSG